MFLISQVGDDPGADKFLQSLQGDIALERVLFRTAGETTSEPSEVCRSILKSANHELFTGRLDEKFKDLVANEKGIEEWVIMAHTLLLWS